MHLLEGISVRTVSSLHRLKIAVQIFLILLSMDNYMAHITIYALSRPKNRKDYYSKAGIVCETLWGRSQTTLTRSCTYLPCVEFGKGIYFYMRKYAYP